MNNICLYYYIIHTSKHAVKLSTLFIITHYEILGDF